MLRAESVEAKAPPRVNDELDLVYLLNWPRSMVVNPTRSASQGAHFRRWSRNHVQGRLAILTCMDARLDPAKYAGLAEGDVHVIRNAGGRATDDAVGSLVISHRLLGAREWFVIPHTNCGMVLFADARSRERARLRLRLRRAKRAPQRGENRDRSGQGETA